MKIIILLTTAVFLSGTCKTKQKANEQPVINTVENNTALQNSDVVLLKVPEKDTAAVAKFTVVFFSIGEGTDSEERNSFENFVDEFQKENKFIFNMKKIPWGREGEVDYCFIFDNVTEEMKNKFVNKVKEMLSTNKLVHLFENKDCRQPRVKW